MLNHVIFNNYTHLFKADLDHFMCFTLLTTCVFYAFIYYCGSHPHQGHSNLEARNQVIHLD